MLVQLRGGVPAEGLLILLTKKCLGIKLTFDLNVNDASIFLPSKD